MTSEMYEKNRWVLKKISLKIFIQSYIEISPSYDVINTSTLAASGRGLARGEFAI